MDGRQAEMRRNPDRTVSSESNLARRLELERRNREWTLEDTAKRMAAVGCPIQPSGVFKIERAGRRIVVNELIAFSKILETSIDELLRPFEVVQDEHATQLVQKWGQDRQYLSQIRAAAERSEAAMLEYFTDNPAVRESMQSLVTAVLWSEESSDPDAEARRILNPRKRKA
jgi:transcriptional regulator with XRE-family HTH domain